jgi:membrane-associated protease RseP (regulator of RpoE activity)
MDWSAFFNEYKTVIIFYSLVILLIFIYRKKFQFEAKFIAMLRTKIGLKLMEKLASKYREFFRIVGYIGIGAGIIGLLIISILMIQQLFSILFFPKPGTGMALLIPGVKLPGSPIFVPLWYGIITIFVIATVHEFSHGILARVYKLKVISSGIVFFGPIIGAFVEPDEKKLLKQSDVCQYSVFAAGPFSNIILAILVFGVWLLLLPPSAPVIDNSDGLFHASSLYDNFLEADGVIISGVNESLPAGKAGLKDGMRITEVNGKKTTNFDEFIFQVYRANPGDTVSVKANNTLYNIKTTPNPQSEQLPYLGIGGFTNEFTFKQGIEGSWKEITYNVIIWFEGLFFWIWALSLSIGLINLLPLGPVDGGRIFQLMARKVTGSEKKGDSLWKKVSWFYLGIIILTLLLSYGRNLLNAW